MPYFTKKGTGKDKGKTCVYKKEGKTKVGCTDGPVEKYLAALHIHESEDFDWLSGPIQIRFGDIKGNFRDYVSVGDTIYISGSLAMGEYEELNPNNSIELDMEPVIVKEFRIGINGGINVIFGNNITTLPLWTSEIANDWVDIGHISSDNDLIITIPEKKSITESEENDLNWIKDIGGDTDSLIAQLKTHIKEHVPVAHLELDWDQTSGGGEYFGRVWLYDRFYELYKYGKTFTVRFYERDPRTDQYHQYDQYENLVQTRLLTILLNELIDYNRKNLNESEEFGDFEWAKEIETDLVPGEIYDIKTGNGYYWVPELYVGRDWDDRYQVNYYKFKDLGGSSGSGRKSEPYVKELIQKGDIRPYDPNWSIKDELTFSDNIEDALKGNFAIYFKNGVYLDQTLAIQDKLFEMGFSFYTKGPNEYVTNKNSSKPIQFFESFNWDTSNPRYKSMPSDQWDQKKILLNVVKMDDFRWRPKPNPRMDDQELFLTAKDHDAIIINGDKYITDNITESEEFRWIEDVEPDFNATMLRYGQKFKNKWGDYIRTIMFVGQDDPEVSYDRPMTLLTFKIVDDPSGYRPYPSYPKDHELNSELTLNPREFDEGLKLGRYVPMFTDEEFKLKESEEFDWIHQQEPEKELKKTKSYVVDVSHLRPTPMRYSHDTSLTRQDILRRFNDLGYDVEGIDIDEAKYFYIEPNKGTGWQYNEYGVPIDYDYWIDYNTHYMEDPSYGGKYQMIDIDELMFLLDNNLISESKKPINEVAGISFESRKWADIIYNEIMSNPEEKTRLIIDGYDYPEAFDQFPIDYVVIDYYDRITGYGQEHSGYDQDGNYVVLLYIQPKLVQGQGGYSLKSALNHEMRHAWEDYNRRSKGLPSIEDTKESKELYTKDFILLMSDEKVVGPIKDILKYFYYLSKLETGPYMENVYDQNPAYESLIREIANKDFESFKDRFDLELNWHLINTNYDIPFTKKFRTSTDFIDYSAKELRSRALKMIKKMNKVKYIHGKL